MSVSISDAIVLKGKDYTYWKDHSEFIHEHAKNFGSPNSFKWAREDYPGSDEDWELLHRILMNHTPSLFIILGDRAVVNPKHGYSQKDLERMLDYLMYVPHKNSLAHFVKHRGPKQTRRERRIKKMTPQATISRGHRKPRKTRSHRTYKRSGSSKHISIPKVKGPKIQVSNSNTYKYKRKVRAPK